ncbi:hypothetical protein B7G55_06875 [Aeromonas hydrophila]|nr:hypothetical protein B7G55_06875 [Aeromonas hydrophila]
MFLWQLKILYRKYPVFNTLVLMRMLLGFFKVCGTYQVLWNGLLLTRLSYSLSKWKKMISL